MKICEVEDGGIKYFAYFLGQLRPCMKQLVPRMLAAKMSRNSYEWGQSVLVCHLDMARMLLDSEHV